MVCILLIFLQVLIMIEIDFYKIYILTFFLLLNETILLPIFYHTDMNKSMFGLRFSFLFLVFGCNGRRFVLQ